MQHLFSLSRVVCTEGSALLPSHIPDPWREKRQNSSRANTRLCFRDTVGRTVPFWQKLATIILSVVEPSLQEKTWTREMKDLELQTCCIQHICHHLGYATNYRKQPMWKWKMCYKCNGLLQEFLLPREIWQSRFSTSCGRQSGQEYWQKCGQMPSDICSVPCLAC